MLLVGMAIEDALKAIIVAQNDGSIGEEAISKNIATHDLKKLWDRAGLRKAECREHDSLLDRLKNFVVTFGRYPVSKTKNNMKTMVGSSFHGDPDFDKVTRLWDFLEKHKRKAIPT